MSKRYNINGHPFHTHKMVVDLILVGSKVLDIGCASGYMARELNKKKCEVWGVDGDKDALKEAKKYCKETELVNLDQVEAINFPKKYFDYIILLDVIEHLCYPEKILKILRPHLKKGGRIIISVPNIAHASMRWSLFMGKFDYTETGLMDKTHVHFYTKSTFEKALEQHGFEIVEILPTNGMTKVPLLRKFTDRLSAVNQYRIAKMWPELFSYQFLAVLRID